MAQPNVVREPSMDEILASIRRIIESNEPVTQAGVATAMAQPEGFSGRPANDDAEEVTLTVDDAFSDHDHDHDDDDHHHYEDVSASPSVLHAVAAAETRPAAPFSSAPRQAAPLHAVPQPQKSLSLADVAARVRAASERGAGVRDEVPAPRSPVTDHPVAEPAHIQAPAPEPVAARTVGLAKPVPESVAEDMQAVAPAAERAEESAARSDAPSLLSASVGEQVARSFQDLAIAIDHSERRSFDEIAEEMLRPMLQEWLDDNLPTLVERLVREEIERVARGPRR